MILYHQDLFYYNQTVPKVGHPGVKPPAASHLIDAIGPVIGGGDIKYGKVTV